MIDPPWSRPAVPVLRLPSKAEWLTVPRLRGGSSPDFLADMIDFVRNGPGMRPLVLPRLRGMMPVATSPIDPHTVSETGADRDH
jgi:hypothetical protein